MSSNETYLEKFIESISTVPTEIQRNLQHMKSLDEQYSQTTEDLRDVQEEYLHQIYNFIHSFHVDVHPQRKKLKRLEDQQDGTQDATAAVTTTEKEKDEPNKKEQEEIDTTEKQETSDKNSNDTDSDDESEEAFDLVNPMEGITVPINNTTTTSSSSQENESKKLMIPTTEELRQLTQNKEALLQIASLRQTAQQITCEKLSTANQNLKVVHSILSKLDQDIAEYENLLKATGQYEDVQDAYASLYVDQLAAIQVIANSQEWILAKVMQHDEHTGMYHLSDEDIESNKSKSSLLLFHWNFV